MTEQKAPKNKAKATEKFQYISLVFVRVYFLNPETQFILYVILRF